MSCSAIANGTPGIEGHADIGGRLRTLTAAMSGNWGKLPVGPARPFMAFLAKALNRYAIFCECGVMARPTAAVDFIDNTSSARS